MHELSALELAAVLRRGEVTAQEVLDHALERAEWLGPQVGAFVRLTPELARAHAREADQLLGEAGPGDVLPPLLGVPCPIKDLTLVAGVPASFGSAAFGGFVPEVDDGVVTLLREAGTVMLGKTTTPELGLPCYTEPDTCPPARTPWDVARSAGGSSGGAAAAVAAGVVPIAEGSDGGGSIRIPASACGLVGLKPSRGRISWGPHGVDGAGLATHGVLTRDVADTAAALDVLAHPWPGDQFLLPGPRTTFLDATRRDPGRLRVGLLTEPVITADAPVHPACREAAEVVADGLADLGHQVERAGVPFSAERWEAFRALWTAGALSVPVPEEAEGALVPLTRWLREEGRGVTGAAYADALRQMQLLAREVARAWSAFDVVLSPTLAQPPAPLGALRDDTDPAGDFAAQTRFTPWTSLYNLTGGPAISLPLHQAQVEDVMLPIGVMLGASVGAEETLLALAAQLEAAMPWRHRRPPVW